jgi:hypothetical protein
VLEGDNSRIFFVLRQFFPAGHDRDVRCPTRFLKALVAKVNRYVATTTTR